MRKIKFQLLFVLFTFAQLNGMDEVRSFIKDHPIAALMTAIGIPTFVLLCYKCFKPWFFGPWIVVTHHQQEQQQIAEKKLFWLQVEGGELYSIEIAEAKRHAILSYYVERFGHSNNENSPLIIGCTKGLDELSGKDINTFLYELQLRFSDKKFLVADEWQKNLESFLKLESFLEIDKRLSKDTSSYSAKFLQLLLHGDVSLSFVFSHISSHTVHPVNNYQRKHFFNNKEFYWTKDFGWRQTFYDKEHNKILTQEKEWDDMNTSLYFGPPHPDGNVILTSQRKHKRNNVVIHNLSTKSEVTMDGDFENWDLSSDGRYVGVRSVNTNTIQIYDTSDTTTRSIASAQHAHLKDFAFNHDGSKLISYGGKKVILWDLQNIAKITSKELFSDMECSGIIFNSDNEHACIINGDHNYIYENNQFSNVEEIILVNIKSGESKSIKFDHKATAFIFPEDSDIIMFRDIDKNDVISTSRIRGDERGDIHDFLTLLLNKNGEMLFLPDKFKKFSCTINGDYIAARTVNAAYIFDHKMTFCGKINSCPGTAFTLEPHTENAMTGSTTLINRLYWSLPDKQTKATLQQISDTTTIAQLTLLEKICSHKREPQQVLVLKDENDKAIFRSFDEDKFGHQSFLKKRLYLELAT